MKHETESPSPRAAEAPDKRPTRALSRVWIPLAALSLVAAAGLFVFARAPSAQPSAEMFAYRPAEPGGPLPRLWQVPAFAFTSQRGASVNEQQLLGHVWIADYIFTTCTNVCPMLSAQMTLLMRELPDEGLRFVSFSVDPAHDTPEVLSSYAAHWRGDDPRWLLLATDPDGLDRLARGMRVAVEPTNDAANPIMHTSTFFLIDDSGMVRGVYSASDPVALSRLAADAVTLRGAAAPSQARRVSASDGQASYAALGCGGCHANPRLAPNLAGIAGKTVTLEGGGTRRADAEYVRDSIVSPGRELTAGYLNLMPAYDTRLSSAELDELVRYVLSLPPDAPSAAPAPHSQATASEPPPPAPPAQATISEDPICHMKVRVEPETPHVTRDGHDYYFCSDKCRDDFLARPHAQLDP